MRTTSLLIVVLMSTVLGAQVNINIDFNQSGKPYSKYIFGKNNSLSDNENMPLTASEWTRIKDAGITLFRENGGNNSTKYNWQRKLGSHPDWYNNVFEHNWDYTTQSFLDNLPEDEIQIMFGFQLLGKAAMSNAHNFDSWSYNQSQWWDGVHQNLAGGGQVNTSGGGQALINGNPDLYLEDWPAESTTGILDHWFGEGGLGFDINKCRFWCMDNEPGIWNGTHDDVVEDDQTMEEYIQKYFAVAKEARSKYPDIKLVGPILANEWQWYSWHNNSINYKGNNYNAMEYFIKRIAEEEEQSGVRLLDVFSIHFYPSSNNVEEVVQYHRVFFYVNYEYPEANGVKKVNGGWDNSINKEFVFKRVQNWLSQYLGNNHQVELAVTETGVNINDPDGVAVWYASTLGEFMKNNVLIYTPWSWQESMWEVLHLFSNSSEPTYYHSNSSNEEIISCYATVNEVTNKATCFIVNRDISNTQSVNINLGGARIVNQNIKAQELNNLKISQTFFSSKNNALSDKEIIEVENTIEVSMNPLSVVAVNFEFAKDNNVHENEFSDVKIFPNPVGKIRKVNITSETSPIEEVAVYDLTGNMLTDLLSQQLELNSNDYQLNLGALHSGIYFLRLKRDGMYYAQKLIVKD